MKSSVNCSCRAALRLAAVMALSLASVPIATLRTARAADVETLLERLRDESGEVRRAAWLSASGYGADAVMPLVRLASADDKDAALAASLALRKLAHAHAAPGSETRAQVATALAGALDDTKVTPSAQELVLDLLGSVGGDESVSAVTALLRDSHLRDAARRALERIPGEAATRAIAGLLPGTTGAFQEALIATLGTRGDPVAVDALTAQAGQGPAAARIAAARALTRVGGPETLGLIVQTIDQGDYRQRGYLVDDVLKMGDRLKAAGREQIAERIYRGVLENSDVETCRYAALHALCRERAGQHVATLLEAMDDESARLRQLATELLSGAEGTAVDGTLLATYGSSSGARKAALLRVLDRRQVATEELVKEALADENVDVKVTALQLSGGLIGSGGTDEAVETLLLEAVKAGSPEVRATALGAYLERANRRVAGAAGVARMYEQVYDLSADKAVKGEALVGLAKVGHRDIQKLIARASEDPDLALAAATARIHHARLTGLFGSREVALDELRDVVSSGAGGRDVRQLAVEIIHELGGDATVAQKAEGLITSWWVIGPFPSPGGSGAFDTAFSPEAGIHLTEQIDHRGRKRQWRAYETLDENGMVDFERIFRRTENVLAYAYTELDVERARDVLLKIGSDDGVKVFLNGEEIHASNVIRGFGQDQDVVKARLDQGKNKLLLKVTQGGGQWCFAARLTERDGQPIDLNELGGEDR